MIQIFRCDLGSTPVFYVVRPVSDNYRYVLHSDLLMYVGLGCVHRLEDIHFTDTDIGISESYRFGKLEIDCTCMCVQGTLQEICP